RGLGLVRDIIDLHGGTIKAETDGNNGVTFCVRLPLAAAPSAVHVDKVREVERNTQAEVRSRLAGTVVLIVDDDPDAREVVGAILRHYGAKVIVASACWRPASSFTWPSLWTPPCWSRPSSGYVPKPSQFID